MESTDKKRCILCGRCVRVCREVIGKAAVSFAFRGTERRVSAPFDQDSADCVGCIACSFICPAWAVKVEEKKDQRYLVPWKTTVQLEKCAECNNHYIPQRLKNYLTKEKPDLPPAYQNLCPDCRRKNTARHFRDYYANGDLENK